MPKVEALTTTTTTNAPAVQSQTLPPEYQKLRQQDIKLPELRLSQAMSPQVNDNDPAFIEGLRVGDFFNSLTETNYGPGPVEFSIIYMYDLYAHVFGSNEEGILERNIPLSDPRCEFGPLDPKTGKKTPPEATVFHDYLIYLHDTEETAVMSLKNAASMAAGYLNGLWTLRKKRIYTGKYTLQSVHDKRDKGNFKNWKFRNAGQATEAQVLEFQEMHDHVIER